MTAPVGIIAASVVARETQLRFPTGVNTDTLSTPDSAAFAFTDLDVSWFGSLDQPTRTSQATMSQWQTTGSQRSWALRYEYASSVGQLRFYVSTTGSNNAPNPVGSAPVTIVADQNFGMRATRRTSDGQTKLYFSPSDPPVWSLLTTATLLSGVVPWPVTAPMECGGTGTATPLIGYMRRAEIRNGYDGAGSVVASPDVRALALGTTSFNDAQGNVWTISGAASLVTRPKPS